MNLDSLERRRDPRTKAFVPILICEHVRDREAPAHLVDLSCSGAAILTTESNTPALGAHVDVLFDTINSDGGSEGTIRRETGVVVNLFKPERGVSRIGVRFLHTRETDVTGIDPIDTLSGYRAKSLPADPLKRWTTATKFQNLNSVKPDRRLAGVSV